MRRLAPDTLDLRFEDLMEMGRARLPGLAPDWTDHNAHDPGITLMELLAWVAEAQLYALGHTRRDQRAAFGALLGLAAAGTSPATGLIWPHRLDGQRPPAPTYAQSVAIPEDAVVSRVDAQTPVFRPAAKLLWVPGRIRRLAGQLADGRVTDFTTINRRGGAAFQPFGTVAGTGDVLVMEYECRGDDGLFPRTRSDADGACWPIGVRADRLTGGESPMDKTPQRYDSSGGRRSRPAIAATLVTATDRVPIRVVSDTSDMMLRTGVLLLDLSAVRDSPRTFAIELRAPLGFERPPRVLRIEPNVIPIVQGRAIVDEPHPATGLPDWSFQLDTPGLRFAPFESPVTLELRDPVTNRRTPWRPARLADSGPDDPVYELDAGNGRVTFGNGVNGRVPPPQSQLLASYAVSDGEEGNVAPNRQWQVAGFLGSFGVNVDAISGGAAPTTWIDERREARRRARKDHALVSSADIEAAALELPLLEVARAWVIDVTDDAPRTGAVTLVAMRARASEAEAGSTPETARWLEAVRRRLSPRMPMTSRLSVVGPRYVDFAVRASVEVDAGRDPQAVRAAAEGKLRQRLSLVGAEARRPGVPVTSRDVTAWIRTVDGVRRVASLGLVPAGGRETDEIYVPRIGLPRLDLSASTLEIRRAVPVGALRAHDGNDSSWQKSAAAEGAP